MANCIMCKFWKPEPDKEWRREDHHTDYDIYDLRNSMCRNGFNVLKKWPGMCIADRVDSPSNFDNTCHRWQMNEIFDGSFVHLIDSETNYKLYAVERKKVKELGEINKSLRKKLREIKALYEGIRKGQA